MARFWLATFMVSPSALDATAAPLLAAGSRNLAIEVLSDAATSEYAVLFSTVDDPKQPKDLTCLLGFTNAAKPCNIWRDRGIPLVDARIVCDEKARLSVFSPYFGAELPMRYESLLFALAGMTLDSTQGAEEGLETRYQQALEAPDGAQPEALITRRAVAWTPQRTNVRRLNSLDLHVEAVPTRYPSLAPLGSGTLTPVSVWAGDAYLPGDQGGRNRGDILGRVSRADVFGVPAFRFEDVEVLGFRIDLGAYGRDFSRDLDRLIRPLNFHLDGASGADAPWDFRYRAATRTLVIELLRYGRMKLKSPSPPAGAGDYQSQHELVVRLLVGRVDDDTAQAHSPAVYVPAIFVDNPWSKVVGRDLQGFDKRMATFWVPQDGGDVPLLPDGRVAAAIGPGGAVLAAGERQPRPLGDISRITLVDKAGSLTGPTLAELDSSPLKYDDWDAFESVDLGLALSSFSLPGTRWRQTDFDEAQFRRSFARSAITASLKGFRSIQVSPVADRGLYNAWITGTFVVDDGLRIARPSGIAGLTLHAVEPDAKAASAPSAGTYWNLLCKMLGDGNLAQISLPTGSWYRLLCSMDLTIDDGLDWTAPMS